MLTNIVVVKRNAVAASALSLALYRHAWLFAAMTAVLAGTMIIPAYAQAPSVGTVYAQRKPITPTANFVGRIQAINRVEVRARVTGFLEKMLFKEGDFVKTGQQLYQIEQPPYQAALEQAQAALARSHAEKILTEVQLKRQETLLAQNSTATSARDEARAQDAETAATILANEASVEVAKINLGYTDIASPIDGKISKTNVTVGNVVGPDSGALTLIVSQDPMYVTFPVSQSQLTRARERAHRPDIKDIKVKIKFPSGITYEHEGTINFIDVSVDRTTDTVLVRATMPNPNGLLIDNQLVSVELETGKPEEKVVVPQAALVADQEGIYVMAVEDGKAVVKRIKVGADIGADIVVEQGLKGGEQIIVEGLQIVRPGQPVQASPMPSSLNRS